MRCRDCPEVDRRGPEPICALSGARVYLGDTAISDEMANKRSLERRVVFNADRPEMLCPTNLPIGRIGGEDTEQYVAGVLWVAAQRGRLWDLLDHYTQAERMRLLMIYDEEIERRLREQRQLLDAMPLREMATAA